MGGGNKSIPDRWLDYKSLGRPIPRTRIVCFKVPLKKEISNSIPETHRFTPDMLVNALPNLVGIIDVTNTPRYYDKQEFLKRGIQHEKILCPGHVVPPLNVVNKFQNAVDNLWNLAESLDKLVGVHCTHGVNRTGYLVCRYLIECRGFQPEEAIRSFGESRGHLIERANYLSDLRTLIPKQVSQRTSVHEGQSHSGWATNTTSTQTGGWRQRNAPDERYSQSQHRGQSYYNQTPLNRRIAPSDYTRQNHHGQPDFCGDHQDSQVYLQHNVGHSYGHPSEQSHRYSTQSHRNPSQSHAKPSQSHAKPSQSYQNTTQSRGNPAQSYQNPSQSRGNPAQSYQNPSQSRGNPSQFQQNPSQSRGNPSQSRGNPAQSYQNPSQSRGNPSQFQQNPSQPHRNSSQSHTWTSYSHPEAPHYEHSRDHRYSESNPSKQSSHSQHRY